MRNEDVVNKTIIVQATAIANLANDETINQIEKGAQLIFDTDGLVIFSGIGKSGNIAKKIVSTFNSIGISSHYFHPVEALHGDFGVLSKNDVVVLISNSGNTREIVELLQLLQGVDATTISITSNSSSKLGRRSDHHINTRVIEEGAITGLIPMASATTTMVVGDCLANILMNQNGFTENDFAQYHPGGVIGKKLDFEVGDIIDEVIEPVVPGQSLLEASLQMSEGQKGIVAVVDSNQEVLGVVTDGDLRREVSRGIDAKKTIVDKMMTTDPVTMPQDNPAIEALKIMEAHHIGQIVLTNEENKYTGIIHMRDLVREGIT